MCLFTYTEFRLMITDHNMIIWETQCCFVLYCNDPTHTVHNVHYFCLSKLWYRRLHLHLLKHSAHAKLGQRVICMNTQTVWSKWSWNKTINKMHVVNLPLDFKMHAFNRKLLNKKWFLWFLHLNIQKRILHLNQMSGNHWLEPKIWIYISISLQKSVPLHFISVLLG